MNILKHLSASRAQDYIKCPAYYYMKYILKIPHQDNPELILGAAIHKTIEYYFNSLMKYKRSVRVITLLKEFNKHYDTLLLTRSIKWKKNGQDSDYYKTIGQPALIPGTMGSASYLCVGKQKAMDLSFGSTAHGSGRMMSRSKAKKQFWGSDIKKDLNKLGIMIKAASMQVIAEEAPGAYKDIDQVVQVSHDLGIVDKVVRLVPIGVVKG